MTIINNSHQVIENTRDASYKIKPSIQNVAGVKLPVFDKVKDDSHKGEMLGISRGGEAVQKCRVSYTITLDDLIKLASLQTGVKTLDEALKVTNRRVNALEFVIMPMLQNTIKYINAELDELEREDSYRYYINSASLLPPPLFPFIET
jgi:V-type H+-transporting ATPase subunit D